MGLARVSIVAKRLGLDFTNICVVTVAGTNGKGTTCRFIEQACLKSGYKVGLYSSPHIENFNERIRLQGLDAADSVLCDAFAQVHHTANHATNDVESSEAISLSYFEYATLCALLIFSEANVDVCLLEVGLGGRLDATNIIDANIGVITSIGLDHQSYLGDTTELIAAEKAGIIKPAQKVVIGYADMHDSVKKILGNLNSKFTARDIDFGICDSSSQNGEQGEGLKSGWINILKKKQLIDLTRSCIPAQNIMTAIAALHFIAQHFGRSEPLLLTTTALHKLIPNVSMPGRLQTLCQSPHVVLDVAHNEDSAKYLVHQVKQIKYKKCHIIIGMLEDKNVEATIDCLAALDATWYCTDLPTKRGEKAPRLINAVNHHSQACEAFTNVKLALKQAINQYRTNDMILVVGSFVLAAECMSAINELAICSTNRS